MLQAGRLKLLESMASVYVRLCDAQRMGSVEGPANEAAAQPFLKMPPYIQEGSRIQYDMQTMKTAGRTYDNARWGSPYCNACCLCWHTVRQLNASYYSSGMYEHRWHHILITSSTTASHSAAQPHTKFVSKPLMPCMPNGKRVSTSSCVCSFLHDLP